MTSHQEPTVNLAAFQARLFQIDMMLSNNRVQPDPATISDALQLRIDQIVQAHESAKAYPDSSLLPTDIAHQQRLDGVHGEPDLEIQSIICDTPIPSTDLVHPDAKLQSFQLFSLLPAEIRVMILKMSFTPRRVILKSASSRPAPKCPSMLNLQLVNWEANQVFHANYKPCFDGLGQKSILFNFGIDTLALFSGLKSLDKLARQYPRVMQKMKRIQLRSKIEESYGSPGLEEKMDLSCLGTECMITIRGSPGEGEIFCVATEAEIIWNLELLKRCLLRIACPGALYQGPRLMGLFTSDVDIFDRNNVDWLMNDCCIQTTTDLSRVRWGHFDRRKPNPTPKDRLNFRGFQEDLEYEWVGGGAWVDTGRKTYTLRQGCFLSRMGPPDIFSHMYEENKFDMNCEKAPRVPVQPWIFSFMNELI